MHRLGLKSLLGFLHEDFLIWTLIVVNDNAIPSCLQVSFEQINLTMTFFLGKINGQLVASTTLFVAFVN